MSLELYDCIGNGGYGEVFRGRWKYQRVAIKRFFLSTSHMDEMIKKEVDIIRSLRNRHVIQFYDVLDHDGRMVIITDYAENGSLYSVVHRSDPFPWNRRMKIINNIIEGLTFLHQNKIIHADLKSLNVLMDEYFAPKLCDFGMSRVRLKTSATTNKNFKGTVRWSAPEVFTTGQSSFKSDIFSLAIVMWEIACWSGKIPYEHLTEDMAVMFNVNQGHRESIPNDTPDDLRKMIEQCWLQDPKDRPNAEDLISLDDTVSSLHISSPEISLNFTESLSLDTTSPLSVTEKQELPSNNTAKLLSFEDTPTLSLHEAIILYDNKKYSQALEAFMSLSDNSEAQLKIGFMYEKAFGVERDYTKAMKWYLKAAEQNHADAQYNVGLLFENVHKDVASAVGWYSRAAGQNHVGAQRKIGDLYGYSSREEHRKEAFKWYSKAADNGDKSAAMTINFLNKERGKKKWYNLSS